MVVKMIDLHEKEAKKSGIGGRFTYSISVEHSLILLKVIQSHQYTPLFDANRLGLLAFRYIQLFSTLIKREIFPNSHLLGSSSCVSPLFTLQTSGLLEKRCFGAARLEPLKLIEVSQ